MATYSEEGPIGLKFYRDKGSGLSYSLISDTVTDLPDDGAMVRFNSSDQDLNIYFGYTSPSGKDYKRDLDLDIHQVIELRDFLNNHIDERAMTGKHIYVFSYGANMLSRVMSRKIKSAKTIDSYELKGFKLFLNKKGSDGSVKANIVETGNSNDSIWGMIYRVALNEKPVLDELEDFEKGYQLIKLILSLGGERKMIRTYVATVSENWSLVADDKPYSWYLNFLIEGAIKNGFPNVYINELRSFTSKADADAERRQKNEELLKSAKERQ